jgi:competence protein ComGC
MIAKVNKTYYKLSIYKLLIYTLIIALLLMLYLGSSNLIEGNTCINDVDTNGLLNTVSCMSNYNSTNNNNNAGASLLTDMSSACVNNENNTINNIIAAGGLGNQASDLYYSTGQLVSSTATAYGLCNT